MDSHSSAVASTGSGRCWELAIRAGERANELEGEVPYRPVRGTDAAEKQGIVSDVHGMDVAGVADVEPGSARSSSHAGVGTTMWIAHHFEPLLDDLFELLAAIREEREASASGRSVLPAMQALQAVQDRLDLTPKQR